MRLTLIIILIIMATSASAEQSVTNFFGSAKGGETLALMGDLSPDADAYFVLRSQLFGSEFEAMGQDDDGVEAAIAQAQAVILIGGPCANTRFWNKYSSETCDTWPLAPGQAMVKRVQKNGKDVILLSGTTREDTLEIARKIVSNPAIYNEKEHVLDTAVALNPTERRCEPGNIVDYGECVRFTQGMSIPLLFDDGNEMRITLQSISDDGDEISILVNQDSFTMALGEERQLSGMQILYDSYDYSLVTGALNKAWLHFEHRLDLDFGMAGWTVVETPLSTAQFGILDPYRAIAFSDGYVLNIERVSLDVDANTAVILLNGVERTVSGGDTFEFEDTVFTAGDAFRSGNEESMVFTAQR